MMRKSLTLTLRQRLTCVLLDRGVQDEIHD